MLRRRRAIRVLILAVLIGWVAAAQAGASGPVKILDQGRTITKAKALELARNYIQVKKYAWGEPSGVSRVDKKTVVVFDGPDGKPMDEAWEKSFQVHFSTTKEEQEIKGPRTVVISLDGRRIGITARD